MARWGLEQKTVVNAAFAVVAVVCLLKILRRKRGVISDLSKLRSLQGFKVTEKLKTKQNEFAAFLGYFGDKNDSAKAIVKVRKIMPKDLHKQLSNMHNFYCKGQNKGWGWFTCGLDAPSYCLDVFFPRILNLPFKEEKSLIKKLAARLRAKTYEFVVESPDDYERATKSWIESIPESDANWVKNLTTALGDKPRGVWDLDEDKVKEKILWSDPNPETGFVLCPDPKWKSHPKLMSEAKKNPKSSHLERMYFLAMPVRQDLRTLRDLRGEHLPLLKNIRDKSLEMIAEVYRVPRERIRVFVHYLPQFYYFHVHFAALAIDYGIFAGKAKLFDEVISNLEMDGEYYRKATLGYTLPKNHSLQKKLLACQKKN